MAGVEWVVLTDGDQYRIYNSHATVPVEKKIFRIIRISDENSPTEETLTLLSKEQMRENRIEVLWKAHFVDRQIRTTIEQLFAPDPDKSLIHLVKKRTPTLSTKDIKASLDRARVILDFPTEPDIYTKPRHRKTISSIKIQGKVSSATGVTPLNLIQAGLVRPPLELKKTYKGHELTARIEVDGRVTCLGKTYNSLSESAGMAIKSIIGAPLGQKYPPTNGWHFWQFQDQDGELKHMDILRKFFLAKK